MKTETSGARTTCPSPVAGRSRTACAARRLPLLLLLLVPAAVHAQYNYTTNNGTITITGYTGPGGVVAIPGTINGLPVTGIGAQAFDNCTSVTSVTIPDNVTGIGDRAFRHCTSLTSVTIGNRVTNIGSDAFNSCALTSLTFPNSVTGIGDGVCSGCSHLASVTFSDNLTRIPAWSFDSCPLTSITIPNHVTSIGDGAFASCPLTSLTIPDSVATIGNWTFPSCPLTSLTLGAGLVSLGDGAFNSCTRLTSVTIPNSVVSIGGWAAFGDCSGLTRVTIGTGVTSLGDAAFQGCTSLLGIYFKGNAPSPGDSVFDGDDSATVYYLPGTTGWDTTFGGRPTALWPANSISGTVVPVSYVGDISNLGARIDLTQGGVTVLTEKVFLDANGGFTVSNVDPGTYDVAVTIGGWLKGVKQHVTVTGSNTNAGVFQLQGADANGDNVVSFEDFAILQNDYNHSGASGANPLSMAAANSATGGCGALGIVLVSLLGLAFHTLGFRPENMEI